MRLDSSLLRPPCKSGDGSGRWVLCGGKRNPQASLDGLVLSRYSTAPPNLPLLATPLPPLFKLHPTPPRSRVSFVWWCLEYAGRRSRAFQRLTICDAMWRTE